MSEHCVGEEYRDAQDPAEDEFQTWIRGPLDSGIDNSSGIRPLYPESDKVNSEVAAFVIVSSEPEFEARWDRDVWEDEFRVDEGEIVVWGDAKKQSPDDDIDPLDFPGNQELVAEKRRIQRRGRTAATPILVYRKPRSGYVEFVGLCILDAIERADFKQDFDNVTVWTPNYRFHLSVLDADTVDLGWLHDRAMGREDNRTPDMWNEWTTEGATDDKSNSDVESTTSIGSYKDTSGTRRSRGESEVRVSDSFREMTFNRYNHKCLLTELRNDAFLTLSHILPRASYPKYAEHPENVMILNWVHHRAFDADIFTFGTDLTVHVDPTFSTGSEFLHQTLVERDGRRATLPEKASVSAEFLRTRNENIGWM